MVAVAAHRRVRSVILASAGAAGVATGSYVLLALLTAGPDPWLGVAFVLGLLVSLLVAVGTWVVMKLAGKLPRAEDQDPRDG
jgi:Na+/H+-dicarboxylate symporter